MYYCKKSFKISGVLFILMSIHSHPAKFGVLGLGFQTNTRTRIYCVNDISFVGKNVKMCKNLGIYSKKQIKMRH